MVEEMTTIEDIRHLFEDSDLSTTDNPSALLKQLRDKLYSMFCSPMKEEFTHEAFKWVSHLCMTSGDFSWVSPEGEWNPHEAKIFSCIVRLSLAELHILLPSISRHVTCGDQVEVEDGKLLARSANLEEYDRFGNHLIIMESAIKSLVKGQELDDVDVAEGSNANKTLGDSMDANDLKTLLEGLKDIMTMICDYLELVHRYWQDLSKELDSIKFLSAEGALRIMCLWLSEDPGSFDSQCKRFLIELIIKNLNLADGHSKDDLLVLALHSIYTNDEVMRSELSKQPQHKEALEKYLDFVQKELTNPVAAKDKRRQDKMFKLRCGLIKDLIS